MVGAIMEMYVGWLILDGLIVGHSEENARQTL